MFKQSKGLLSIFMKSNQVVKRQVFSGRGMHVYPQFQQLMAANILNNVAIRNASKGATYAEYSKANAKFGKDRQDSSRAEYEKELKERTSRKLNWNIKNRWEQRALDDVLQNNDVKAARFRDFTRLSQQKFTTNIQEFNSVDEIYFFLNDMFSDGFDEHHISIALDVFLRDIAQFEEEDLASPTFKQLLRELGRNMMTFQDEKNYVKVAQFLDWFCIDDKLLWVNLEQYIEKKDKIFSANSYIRLLTHFSNQNEGSRSFYDNYEHMYNSKMFDKQATKDIVQIAYSYYQVHAGTIHFFQGLEEDLVLRLNDSVSTFDLLRVLQAFSEISSDFARLFVQLETLFLKRLDQMTPDEMTCCGCGFAISGFGSPFLFKYIEQNMVQHISEFTAQNVKELCRAFIFSSRGTKEIHQTLMPRIQQIIHTFTCRELCYLLHGYVRVGFLPKPFAKLLEAEIVKTLRDVENVELEVLQLMAQVFCRSRSGSREFHKLFETTILMRLDELKKNSKVLYAIGYEFEKSGLCSLDTLKILKKQMFQVELEQDVFQFDDAQFQPPKS